MQPLKKPNLVQKEILTEKVSKLLGLAGVRDKVQDDDHQNINSMLAEQFSYTGGANGVRGPATIDAKDLTLVINEQNYASEKMSSHGVQSMKDSFSTRGAAFITFQVNKDPAQVHY